MPERKRFRCNNCGHRFEEETLTEDERHEAERKRMIVYNIQCPQCCRTDIRNGWE